MFLVWLAVGCVDRCVPVGDLPLCSSITYCCEHEHVCGYVVAAPRGKVEFQCESVDDCEEAKVEATAEACNVELPETPTTTSEEDTASTSR